MTGTRQRKNTESKKIQVKKGKDNESESEDGENYINENSNEMHSTSSERSRLDDANADNHENNVSADNQREEAETNEDNQVGQKVDASSINKSASNSKNKIGGKKEANKEKRTKKEPSKIVLESARHQNKKESQSSLHVYLFGIGILVVGIICCPNFADFETIIKGHTFRSRNEFVDLIGKMKLNFPNQYPEYWNLLRNSGKRHLDRIAKKDQSDLRPMSLLFIAFEESESLVECYLENIGKAYTQKSYKTIDSHEFTGVSSRNRLDSEIQASLNSKQKLVIIKNLQQLSFDAAQLFMTYADEHNDVHNYPQSVIFMSAVLPFPSSNDRRTDEQRVHKFFVDEIWGSQDTMDNKAALWSRVGDGIVIIRNEPKNSCKK